MSDSYQYKPLQGARSIRLLKILPGEDRIYCSLIEVDEWAPYFALSYTWGCPDEDDPATGVRDGVTDKAPFLIYCEGKTLEVTENCYNALQRLREVGAKAGGSAQDLEFCWIDAICIDQSNLDERAAQVVIMADIYASARLVVIWLGEIDPDMTGAISSIWTFGKALQSEFLGIDD